MMLRNVAAWRRIGGVLHINVSMTTLTHKQERVSQLKLLT